MTSADIVRYIDSIARDREIDKEGLFLAVEEAVRLAIAKKYGVEDLELNLNRETGQWVCNYEISMEEQGRIMAQAVKQAIFSRVREAERDVLYLEYEQKLGEIISGTVQRIEGSSIIVNLGRNMEGLLPQVERVRTENFNIGVKKVGPRLKVILSRAHRDMVRCLFELEVPEIASGTIQIRRIEREPGYRTKLAVWSSDPKVDCVGACVGVRGTRIKSIMDELNGERIDIIRWNDDPQTLIMNALKPADVGHIELDSQTRKALVLVTEDQLSLAIGRKGQNVRLASKLTGWDIDIMTRAELEKSVAEETGVEETGVGGEAAEGDAAPLDPSTALAVEGAPGGEAAADAQDSARQQDSTKQDSPKQPSTHPAVSAPHDTDGAGSTGESTHDSTQATDASDQTNQTGP
jgi:N utilization substance protein A